MTDHLQELIEKSRRIKMTNEQEAAQRRSFAYGNTKIENDSITREMIDNLDRKLQSEK